MRTYIHPTLETIQMSFNWLMNKQPVVHPYSGTLLGDKKEHTVDPHKNLDESHRHHAEWKKPVSKGYILNDPTYIAFSKRQSYRDGQQINGCQSGGWGRVWMKRDYRRSLWVMDLLCILIVVVVTRIYIGIDTQRTVHMSKCQFYCTLI